MYCLRPLVGAPMFLTTQLNRPITSLLQCDGVEVSVIGGNVCHARSAHLQDLGMQNGSVYEGAV